MRFKCFFLEEDGQNLVEYTLLMAALALACGAVIIGVGQSSASIWSTVNSRLNAAAK